MEMQPAGRRCEECLRIAQALRAAWRDDARALRTRVQDVAASSGRSVRQFGIGWVMSVAAMPEPEMQLLLASHYPRVADANRNRAHHETSSGHSLAGWRALFLYDGDQSV
jgi:hypothetical protein